MKSLEPKSNSGHEETHTSAHMTVNRNFLSPSLTKRSITEFVNKVCLKLITFNFHIDCFSASQSFPNKSNF
ncbi:hypothetical protein EGR_08518 [Echinococcus granulosus]|uniref:Uncharacterized protein n=1 Tax=Echinococcus granulosus TaxID=6210 RepID=W6UES6_ECHGR|nr:hypothetical protein EGR_08518 [Echinococcus granulosus]EUB56607.1 hypothetical protein EGR_08518 [Echinococcus granulosus]